jgi:radical S-adenosyl methionine domain-containing protein 2
MRKTVALGASLVLGATVYLIIRHRRQKAKPTVPISVNFHFLRRCNYSCGFCFHTAKTSHVLPIAEAKRGLSLLKAAGTRKINFAGGEPFLERAYLGELLQHSKQIGMESVSIVSNGSRITRDFLKIHADSIDVLAVSCDSFNKETNRIIGRKSGDPFSQLRMIAKWCREFDIKFKLNTVVNRYNVHEDMNEKISALNPFRWKCFQVLIDETENRNPSALRDVTPFLITDEEFTYFVQRHRQQPSLVEEPNDVMRSSYLILDEYMRFLSKEGDYRISPSILEVGVREALDETVWRQDRFLKRRGIYEWSKGSPSLLDW